MLVFCTVTKKRNINWRSCLDLFDGTCHICQNCLSRELCSPVLKSHILWLCSVVSLSVCAVMISRIFLQWLDLETSCSGTDRMFRKTYPCTSTSDVISQVNVLPRDKLEAVFFVLVLQNWLRKWHRHPLTLFETFAKWQPHFGVIYLFCVFGAQWV